MIQTKSFHGIISILILTILYVFTLSSAAISREVIKIGGTGSALGSIRILAENFEKVYPSVRVVVLPSLGSSGAIKALSEHAIDIGLLSRPFHEDEKELNLTAVEYTKTPFVFVVNRAVNTSEITTSEIIKIYRGEEKIWPDGKRIRLVIRPNKETDTLILRKISSEMNRAVNVSQTLPGMQLALTDQENADKIENIPGAFGTSTLTQIIAEKRTGIKILSYDGVEPSTKNISNGTYNLFKCLSILINKDCSESARNFISFIKTSQGRKILEDSGNMVTIK